MSTTLNPTAVSVGRSQERVRAAEERANEIATEIRELSTAEDMTDEQEVRLGQLLADYETANADAEKVRTRYAALEAAASIPENRVVGDASGTMPRRTKKNPYDFDEIRSVERNGSPREVSQELRSRALDAIEQAPEYVSDDARNQATKLIDVVGRSRGPTGERIDWRSTFARHMLEHGSPEYTDAFLRYIDDGPGGLEPEERASLSTTGANGGFLIPFFLDPTVILSNAGTWNPIRQIAKTVTIPTNVWHGVSSAGVTASYQTESATVTDGSPTFAQPTCTPQRATAYVTASFEVVQDSNVSAEIGGLFADAKDRLESSKFVNGAGDASAEPLGIVTRLQAVTASRVASNTNAVFQSGDVINLMNQLSPRWQRNASWLGHYFTANLIRQQVLVNNPTAVAGGQWADYGVGVPSTLLGRPFYQTSEMKNAAGTIGLSSATSSNDDILIFGDFSNMIVVDRIGMEVVYNPLVISSATATPTGQVGWFAIWRSSSNVLVDDAFRLLRV